MICLFVRICLCVLQFLPFVFIYFFELKYAFFFIMYYLLIGWVQLLPMLVGDRWLKFDCLHVVCPFRMALLISFHFDLTFLF